jgi:cell division protein FtsW
MRRLDLMLLISAMALICLGLVMVASASVSIADQNTGDPLHYFSRQLLYVLLGAVVMVWAYRVRLEFWQQNDKVLLVITVVMLVLVLIPGIGKLVNGSSRWLPLGIFNFQVSELAKLVMIIYLSGYLVRHQQKIRLLPAEMFRPIAVVMVLGLLLLMEPDFGATAVMMATTLIVLYLGGARLAPFVLVILLTLLMMSALAMISPERMERITSFFNPWEDPYESGFQLTQSLIAIGSGAWFGQGLGESIQKLFYLPEAHTDFLFAVLAEELGLVGVSVVIVLFTLLVWRCFAIGTKAHIQGKSFGAYLSYGVGVWIAIQAFINMGVNMGMLPTKGLTLPLMSAGGSSMLVTCLALGLVFRVHRETYEAKLPGTNAHASRYRVNV